jgi:hypothetical protein
MTHDKYDTDILKTLMSIKEFLNSLHRKNVQREDTGC